MWVALLIVVQVSMGLMFIPIFLELHFLFAMAALFGGITLCIGLLSGETVYSIDEQGIAVQIRPMLPWKWWKYEKKKFYAWNRISSYSIGEDMTRGLEKFHFINVEVHGLANDLKISDNGKFFAGFEEFKSAFIAIVEARNVRITGTADAASTLQSAAAHGAKPVIAPPKEKLIQRKRSFYERPIAKIITVLFILLMTGVGIFYLYYPQYLKWEHVFKISFIIIPGIGYLFYRSFLEKKN